MTGPTYFDNVSSRQWDPSSTQRLKHSVRESGEIIQRMRLMKRLDVHQGCVNTLSWNKNGTLLLSGSDDHKLVISNPFTSKKVHEVHTSHRANIFSAKFLPETSDLKLVSCAGDGMILYTDILREEETAACTFNCHAGTVYEMLSIPGDPNTFLSCGEDGTVRWYDLRMKTSCFKDNCKEDILIGCHKAVTSISVNPMFSYQLAVGCSDSNVRIFDRRLLGTRSTGFMGETTGLNALISRFSVQELGEKQRRITSVSFRPDGQEVLASYSSDYIYIFDPKETNTDHGMKLKVGRPAKKKSSRNRNKSPQPMKKLRLRGDWSDTGPNSRPETEAREEERSSDESADRENLQTTLMQRMTDALSRMLNDPSTRLAMQRLNHGEGSEASGIENREQSQEASSTVQSDIRQGLNLNDEESQSASQSRAASAIQDRWRRYRQRKAAEEVENTSHHMETDDKVELDLIYDDEEIQLERPCASSVLCCGSNRVSPNPEIEDSLNEKEDEPDTDGPPSLKKMILAKYRSELNENEESSADNFVDEEATSKSDTGEKSKKFEAISGNELKESNDNSDNNEEEISDEDVNMENIDQLEDSYADLRETGVEPTLEITVRNEGTSASSISIGECEPLPGPSRVVTGPGQVGFDPVTGARRRRSGISSVPTSSILNDNVERKESIKEEKRNIVEYETFDTDDSDDSEEEININFEDPDKAGPQSNRRTINQPPILKKFTGHRNARTMIKEAAWWGNDFILSGSDCGHLFAWNRKTTKLVMMLEADRHVVNCVQPHPTDPFLATSGIDYDVKLWAPTGEYPQFDEENAEVVMKRNEVMLEETRDTITVPASLMIRMLASLNQIRRVGHFRDTAIF